MTSTLSAAPVHRPARPFLRAWRAPDRWLASLCLLACAGTHAPLVPDHLREAPYVGVAFIVLVVASIALAVVVTVWDAPIVWSCVALLNVLAVVAYVVTRTVGLPLLADDLGNWTEPLSFPALAAELLAIAASWSAWTARRAVVAPHAV